MTKSIAGQAPATEFPPAEPESALAAPRKTSWVPLITIAGTIGIVGGLLMLMNSGVGEVPTRTPSKFLLPQGFSGDVKVYYEVEGAAALPTEEGYRVLAIPPSGTLKTSSEVLYGKAPDLFVRLNGDDPSVTLGYHYIRDRKSGLTGDNKEYFLRPEQLEMRDALLISDGITTADGLPRYEVPYEMFTVRDDF